MKNTTGTSADSPSDGQKRVVQALRNPGRMVPQECAGMDGPKHFSNRDSSRVTRGPLLAAHGVEEAAAIP